jgi:hypothetical protein
MSAGDFLARLVALLEAAGIPHMVAGSFASTFHGVARATQDLDIVVEPSAAALDAFLASLDPDVYYVDPDTARDALRRRSQFNVIDMTTGWKADLIIRKARPFSIEEFARRQPAELLGTRTYVATAEDSIVAKLEWAKQSDSTRQLRDVAGIVAMRAGALDLEYVERWVSALSLDAAWASIRAGDLP